MEFHSFLVLIFNIYFMDLMLNAEREREIQKKNHTKSWKKRIFLCMLKKYIFRSLLFMSIIYMNNYNNYFQTTIKFLSISLSNRCSKNTRVFLHSLMVFLCEDRFFLFIPIIVLKPSPAGRPGNRPIQDRNWAGLKKK